MVYFFNIKKLIINFIYFFTLVKNFFNFRNYDIIQASIEYNLKDIQARTPKHIFWKKEKRFWTSYSNNYWVDITNYFRPNIYENLIKKIPTNVENFTLYVKYFYNGKNFNYISRNQKNYTWPPKTSIGGFSLPIKSAVIYDEDGNEIKDVSKKVRKCAGPKNNFHNQQIKASDLFTYVFRTLKITDIVGVTKTFNYDDFIN